MPHRVTISFYSPVAHQYFNKQLVTTTQHIPPTTRASRAQKTNSQRKKSTRKAFHTAIVI